MHYSVTVLDKERTFSNKKFIVSKTDREGNILFVNKNFCELSGYSEVELLGSSHKLVRHPDMPQAIFYMMWQSFLEGRENSAVIKNLAKSGQYYWVISDFSVHRDAKGDIVAFTSCTQIAPTNVSEVMSLLYAEMKELEKREGIKASLQYLERVLGEKKMNYNEFLEALIEPKGLFNTFVHRCQKLLS